MKDIMEEYGGMVVTCIMALILIILISSLVSSDGQLHELAKAFYYSIGASGR